MKENPQISQMTQIFLCAFAPLRLCAFAPLRLCAFALNSFQRR